MADSRSTDQGLRIALITVSDGVARREREDLSGSVLREMLAPLGSIELVEVVPDELSTIEAALIRCADRGMNLVVTTGGTGLGPRDVTPEATRAVIEREVPGLGEAMRSASLAKTPLAMLSRAVCGTRSRTLIINLPGSPKGVRECLEVVLPVLTHAAHIQEGGGH